jgi:excisionase family DNA binding protein
MHHQLLSKNPDPRVQELFRHVKASVDILEKIISSPLKPQPSAPTPAKEPCVGAKSNPPPELTRIVYSITEVAELVSMSRTSIYNIINSGKLPCIKWGRGSFIRASDIRAWIDTWQPL